MLARPTDPSGDILPVRSLSDLLSGAAAVAAALRDELNFFAGDWWENPSHGNELPDLLQDARGTDREAETLTACLVSLILSFEGVLSVENVRSGFENRVFRFSCTVRTESGEAAEVDL